MTESVFAYPAKVRRIEVQARQASLLALAKASSAYDPAIFDERTPFFWAAEISNDQVDAYYTHMLPSTLRNFADGARAGVAFLNSHRHHEFPLGRSLDGRLVEEGDRQRVLADFFTMPGLNLNGVTTDDFIAGVRAGIVADVSVGFHGGQHWCDICRQNYLSWDCPHLAGMKYEVQGSEGLVVCTVGIDNARLSEVSGVYDGATPDATIVKARQMAEAGDLKPEAAAALAARYRTAFVVPRRFAGMDLQERKQDVELEQLVNQLREVLGVDAKGDVVSAVLALQGEVERLRTVEPQLTEAQQRIKELEPQADAGRAYREDLISEALAEGVRAYGEKFNQATYEAALRNASLDLIKQMRSDWQAVGNARFAGGRQTTDGKEQAPGGEKRRTRVPQKAYAV